MTSKTDAKFEKKLTLGFKKDMRYLVNFHPATQKSKISLQLAIYTKVYEV